MMKIKETGPREHNHAPWAWQKHVMRLGHLPCALGISKFALDAPWACPMRPEHLKCEGRMHNFMFCVGYARVFSLNSFRNSHYKYQPSSFKLSRSELWLFKRKATLELQESFYLLLYFLGYVFVFSNLFLVTMCN